MGEGLFRQGTCKMKLKKGEWILIFFNLAYIIVFSVYYLSTRNYEFLWYILVIGLLFSLILGTIRKTNFDYLILWGLSLWTLMHLSGGSLIINGDILYKLTITAFEIGGEAVFRFDKFTHFWGFAVTTVVGYHLLKPYLKNKTNWKVLYPLIVLIGMGAGVINEIVEFIAVVSFPETGVGGYANTMLDSIFNTIGAIAGAIIIYFRRKNEKVEKRR